MSRLWYLSRGGQVFGPVTDAQLSESAATGRILPTDQLNVAGQPNWWPTTAIPGLLPAPNPIPAPIPAPVPAAAQPEPEPIPAEVIVEMKTLRVTCFACFREVTLEFAAGTQTAHCPKCRSAIETGEPAAGANPTDAQAQAAFGKLESKREFKERMQKKVADAQAAAGRDGAALGGILGAIISQ